MELCKVYSQNSRLVYFMSVWAYLFCGYSNRWRSSCTVAVVRKNSQTEKFGDVNQTKDIV